MSELKLKVYENDMKTVKKECTAQTVEVPFGAVRRLMRLFDIDSKNNNADILKTIICKVFIKHCLMVMLIDLVKV